MLQYLEIYFCKHRVRLSPYTNMHAVRKYYFNLKKYISTIAKQYVI